MPSNIPQVSFPRFTVILCFLLNAPAAMADEAAAFAAFDQLNAFDIQTAQIAVKKAHSEGVRALAQMIVDDHSPIQQDVRRIAARYGLTATAASNPEYAQTIANLNAAEDAAFDKAYMLHELPFSKAFVRKLQEEIIPAVVHEDLKAHLQSLSPKLEEHLMHIKHTAMQLDMETGGMDHKTEHDKK